MFLNMGFFIIIVFYRHCITDLFCIKKEGETIICRIRRMLTSIML